MDGLKLLGHPWLITTGVITFVWFLAESVVDVVVAFI